VSSSSPRLGRPIYDVDVGSGPHYTVSDVSEVFAAEGFALSYSTRDQISKLTISGSRLRLGDAGSFYVTVLPETGTLGLAWTIPLAHTRLSSAMCSSITEAATAESLAGVKKAVGALRPWNGRYGPMASSF
jgi:hypothetical protein